MAISKLLVGGFKSLKTAVEIPLAPITLVFGPNSVGKSVIKDALTELKRRLGGARPNDRFSAAMCRIADLDRWAHLLPRVNELDEPSATGVLLGCIDDCFSPNGSTTLAAENEWTDIGRDLYWALADRHLRYFLVDTAGDWTLMHELVVDGTFLVGHSAFHLDESNMTWPLLPAIKGSLNRDLLAELGVLRLNLAHPVAADPRLQRLVSTLLETMDGLGEEWSGRAAWLTDRVLHVRVDAYRRLCQNWADQSIDGFGFNQTNAALAALCGPLGSICFVVNELIRQLEFSLEQDLGIAYVPGSRAILSDEACSTDWFTGDEMRSVEGGLGYTVLDYARWLAETSIDADQLKWAVGDDVRMKDDFVNDCLDAKLFAARRYRVKAEVTLRQLEVIAPRDASRSADAQWSMKSSLYLRDDEGRALSLNQVGSGVSYVLPVLAALWGASRSLIEQPELHLHPAAQCEIGDAIVRAYNRGRFSVIETHSEHLLLRILRRVRQTSEGNVRDRELQCQPESVAVLYFAPDAEGSTQVHQLRVTRGGDFMDRWPDGFFEERSRELFDE